ncbi:MAG: HTTM domain-containing protein [Acidimicrobiia bacterium]|nr:HTTM domain-containing protein [Acidimicrobiia bacterium]
MTTVQDTRRPLGRLERALTAEVNNASVTVVRIAFGLSVVVNSWLYLPILVNEYYVDTTFNFPYGPLTFINPPPGWGMHAVYVAMMACGLLVALGKWYRWAAAGIFVTNTYIFLSDSTYFQNHEYLLSLVAFLFIVLPLDGRWSLDARRHPERASTTVPGWVLWLLRFQVGVPYFYGGIAKLNSDWLAGEPLRMWLERRSGLSVMHNLLTIPEVVWVMAYGSLLLDLLIVPLLLWRRTRLVAFVVVTLFHLTNVWLWGLFIFPWLMIAATTVFFDPDWPERVERWWRARRAGSSADAETELAGVETEVAETAAAAGGAGATAVASPPTWRRWPSRLTPALAVFLTVWVVAQLVLPWRHYAVEGSPNWTEQHHRFAWHMKLRDKQGWAVFHVTPPDGRTFTVDPADHLNEKQTARLAGHPERLVHFSRHLSDLHDGAEVRVETSVSLNGREPQPFVDPTVDLSQESMLWFGNAPWILPLEEPLRP